MLAFPDIDGYATWIEKLAQFPDLHVTVSPILQRNATAEDIEAHIDIADWFIREKLRPAGESIREHSREFLLAAQYLDPEKADEVEALIEDLGLMFMGAEKVEEADEETSDDALSSACPEICLPSSGQACALRTA